MGIWKGCDVIYGGYQKMKAKTTNQNSQRNREANDQTGGLTIKKLPQSLKQIQDREITQTPYTYLDDECQPE